MLLVQVQFVPWDKYYYFSASSDMGLKLGDRVIVKTDLGNEMGFVTSLVETDDPEAYISKENKNSLFASVQNEMRNTVGSEPDNESDSVRKETAEIQNDNSVFREVIRKATAHDLEKTVKLSEKQSALDYAKKMKDKYDLAMKFFDVHFSFDGSRMTFAFIADGRIDFRELVKDMTRYFGRTIRLQQIGIRDEAKIMGDFGHCGQMLCCRRFLKEFNSITSEMAELQQCSHRGSERISGICGRLMCCLFYEHPGYEEMTKKMPPIGANVNVDGKRGEVVGHHTLKQTVDVRFPGENKDDSTIAEVDLNRNKKK